MKTTRHATYNLNYHIVWIPKYGESILVGEVARRVKTILHEIADDKGLEIVDLTTQPDHVHLFVSSPPNTPRRSSPTGSRGFPRGSTTTVTSLVAVKKSSGHGATTQERQATYPAKPSKSTFNGTRWANSDGSH